MTTCSAYIVFIWVILTFICEQTQIYIQLQRQNKTSIITIYVQGSSIIDVTASGGMGYQGFCDKSTKALVKNEQKLRDVIYGRPLI